MKNRDALFAIGRPLSPLYSMLMSLRASMYRAGIFNVTRLDVPVVSVGNITLGGTGKTPVVQYIARLLKSWGWHPAVVSRGYGGTSREKVNIVSRGGQPLLDASCVGDEPRLHAEVLDGVAVLTGRLRSCPAQRAVELGADVVILDDGFQHLGLDRTIDLVLFNGGRLAGNSRVFPGGDLREPLRALKRCDGFIMTGTTEQNREQAQGFAGLLGKRFPGIPVFTAHYAPSAVVGYDSEGEPVDVGKSVTDSTCFYGFSGIAFPENFEQTLHGLGIKIVGFQAFPDHYPYKQADIHKLSTIADQAGAGALITTEKDMVKVRNLSTSIPVYAVRMEAGLDDTFHDFLRERLPGRTEIV
jgi:tetraacyldisaccharide 4'-kinase